MADYNPYILGYLDDGRGGRDAWLPLQEVIARYGDLPSRYGLLKADAPRNERPTLNLQLGSNLTRLVEGGSELKGEILAFYLQWHRNWVREFGITTEPLLNRTPALPLVEWFREYGDWLVVELEISSRDLVLQSGLIRKDVVNSIPDQLVTDKSLEILEKKLESGSSRKEAVSRLAGKLQLHRAAGRIQQRLGKDLAALQEADIRGFSDELVQELGAISSQLPGWDKRYGHSVADEQVSFGYPGRGSELLELGSRIGDCTARPYLQIDRQTENIYWTVFPWLLDPNYAILQVFWKGSLVAKAHLLPLLAYERDGAKLFLAVDAIETALPMRRDLPGEGRLEEWECQKILDTLQGEILRIADAMGVQDVFCELFSNNLMVRQWLERFERVYLDVNSIHKVDELEDLYLFARQLSRKHGMPEPDHLFMELQFRNIQLMSHQTARRNMKGFACLRAGRLSGKAMNQVVGI